MKGERLITFVVCIVGYYMGMGDVFYEERLGLS